MAVNQEPSLRRSPGTSKPKQGTDGEEEEGQADEEAEEEAEEEEAEGKGKGKGRAKEGRAKKCKWEKLRRNTECDHLERICFLFGAPRKGWTRKDALGLGELISLSVDAANHLPISSQPSCSSSTAPTCSRPVSSRSFCRLERSLFYLFKYQFTFRLYWTLVLGHVL